MEFSACLKRLSPVLSSFLPLVLEDFVQPIWTRVDVARKSQPSILPNVSSFPTVPIPREWSHCPHSRANFILCRAFSGSWTLVDVDHVRNGSLPARDIPVSLTQLLVFLNSSHSSGCVSVYFDAGRCCIVEIDMRRELILVTKFCVDTGPSPAIEVTSVPPGAVNICGAFQGRLFLSVGCVLYVVHDGVWRKVSDQISVPKSARRLPVSIQNIVPCFGADELVYFLSGGILMSSPVMGIAREVFVHEHTAYVAAAVDVATNVIVLVGYDTRESVDTQYITLFDVLGKFVIAKHSVALPPSMSLVSVCIDPVTTDVVVIGRGTDTGRHGAICYVLPAVYN